MISSMTLSWRARIVPLMDYLNALDRASEPSTRTLCVAATLS
jgi:hypothetical protein